MTQSTIEGAVVESLGQRRDGWMVEASLSPLEGWVVVLSHPASAGLIITTGSTVERDAIIVASRVLAASIEIDVASAAPTLEHAEMLLGLRTLTSAFSWECREVGAVAFLLFENGHLTHDETGWWSGYDGLGAPMQPRSPLG